EVAAQGVLAGNQRGHRSLTRLAGLERFRVRDRVVLRLEFTIEPGDAEVVLLGVVICHTDGDRLLESDAPAVGTELHVADANRDDSVLRLRSSGIQFLGGGRLALELRSRSGGGVLSDR